MPLAEPVNRHHFDPAYLRKLLEFLRYLFRTLREPMLVLLWIAPPILDWLRPTVSNSELNSEQHLLKLPYHFELWRVLDELQQFQDLLHLMHLPLRALFGRLRTELSKQLILRCRESRMPNLRPQLFLMRRTGGKLMHELSLPKNPKYPICELRILHLPRLILNRLIWKLSVLLAQLQNV